ncbi:MAG: dienelactone hydrolase family protein, partial [Candidatus Planktophila sp.]|nr:dienelactone hydrolase family protein [Candidatus Planktophila sp.]
MTQLTSIGSDGLSAFIAIPTETKGPLLIVLQEIIGINANIR